MLNGVRSNFSRAIDAGVEKLEAPEIKKIREELTSQVAAGQLISTILLVASVIFATLGVVAILSGSTAGGTALLIPSLLVGTLSYDGTVFCKNMNETLKPKNFALIILKNDPKSAADAVVRATKGTLILQHFAEPASTLILNSVKS